MSEFTDRIPDSDYSGQIYLKGTPEGLTVTLDDTENEVAVCLSAHGVRNLRLALARYERHVAQAGSS